MSAITKFTSSHSKKIEVVIPALVKRRGIKTIKVSLAKYRVLRGVWIEVEIGGTVRRQKFYASVKEAIKEFRSTINRYKLNVEGICN